MPHIYKLFLHQHTTDSDRNSTILDGSIRSSYQKRSSNYEFSSFLEIQDYLKFQTYRYIALTTQTRKKRIRRRRLRLWRSSESLGRSLSLTSLSVQTISILDSIVVKQLMAWGWRIPLHWILVSKSHIRPRYNFPFKYFNARNTAYGWNNNNIYLHIQLRTTLIWTRVKHIAVDC